jgi:hypothetical protein
LLTATSSKTSGDWYGFEVISSGAQIALITTTGSFRNSSLVTSVTTYPRGAWFGGSHIKVIKLSTGTVGGAKKASKVIAYVQALK